MGAGGIGSQQQGSSIALAADGSTLAVGAYRDSNFVGATWVFTRRADGGWTQQGSKLVGAGRVGSSQQGAAVSLAADGATLAVGGPYDNGDAGVAWVFTRSTEGEWTQAGGKLVGSGLSSSGDSATFGTSLALAADGSVLAVGAPSVAGGIGATWVFRRSGHEWLPQSDRLVGSGVTGGKAAQG